MNGVEAAASLFGSDEPASDLFATLGADTSTTAPAVGENEISSTTGNGDLFGPQVHNENFPVNDGYSDLPGPEPASQPLVSDHESHGQPQKSYGEQGFAGEYGLRSSYSTSTPQPAVSAPAPAPTTYAKNYTPQSYAAPASYQSEVPAAPPTNSYSNNYAPQTYTPAASTYSAYGQYNPPAPASYYPSESIPKPPVDLYGSRSASHTSTSPQYGTVSAPPPPPPATTTVTRPKVSNAYDPPFLPTKPSRRPVRPTGLQQAYSAYQTPLSPPSYATPSQTASTASSGYFQQSAPTHSEYREASPDIHAAQYQTPPPVQAKSTAMPYYGNGQSHTPSDVLPPPPPRAPSRPTGVGLHASFPSDDITQAHALNVAIDRYAPRRYPTPPTTSPVFASSHPARTASIASMSSTSNEMAETSPVTEAAPQANTSPSMIPLPYSPPIPKADLQSPEIGGPSITENSMRSSTQTNSYAPQQPPKKDPAQNKDNYDPYAPKVNHNPGSYIPRTSSPLSLHNGRPSELRKPSANPTLNLNGTGTSAYNTVPRNITVPLPPKQRSNGSVDDTSLRHHLAPQELIIRSTAAQYAPSPSLVGANDPLSRTSARAPVVTFGFGGKMVTCFHGMPGLNTGFDVALSARTSSELKVHVLHKFLPESALNSPGTSYPGPLVSDPGAPSSSLVRPGLSSQNKTKKSGILAYLSGRAEELHQGLGYLAPAERQIAENKLILVKLLRALVDHDGRLLATPQAESDVRSALVPRLDGSAALQDGVSLQASYHTAPLDEMPISVTSLRPSALTKIQDLLLQGDRRQAYQYAMDEKLWAHAMVIASSIDKESWKEVVSDFLRSELTAKDLQPRGLPLATPHAADQSWDSLRVAYSLFSGQGAIAIQELSPPNLLQRATTGLLQPPMQTAIPSVTPRTPNFPAVAPQPAIPPENLTKWAETVAMIISSPLTPESSSALTALGDQLLACNWLEAAHVCYILSPQTSLLGGLGAPAARLTLVGSKTPANSFKDPDSLIFSEILEFALSLVPTVKGQEPFHGLPHLQAYRFIRATYLSEIGEVQLAKRYCEAIATSLSQSSPYTTQPLVEQLQGLQQRLSGVFNGDKSGSWIGGKLSKPSLDTIGGWLEGRFTKLVTGDSDSPNPATDQAKASDQPFAGPFAHYSTISSTTPSARSSPQPPPAPLNYFPPPQRTTSAMATSSPYSQTPIERSSSAMGYMLQKPSVQTASSTHSISSSQSSPIGYGLNGHARDTTDSYAPKSTLATDEDLETPVQTAGWWGSDDNTASTKTPTAATFMQVEDPTVQPSSEGFISLMDDQHFSFGSQQPSRQASTTSSYDAGDDDDLGLGNNKSKPKAEQKDEDESSPVKETAATPRAAEPTKAAAADTNAGGRSWFGGWFKRADSTTPGPVKASLGEESAFYYDKDLKRWVNKKSGGDEAAKPATPPPPPPSRAQTASPGMSGSRPPPPPGSAPPPRSASAIDLSNEPPMKAPMRIRSNLAPPTESAPSTPTGLRPGPGAPPPGRPRSQASKRNIRSRYVDVFQEGGGAS